MNKRLSNKDNTFSRRGFLKSAAIGGAAIATSARVIEAADTDNGIAAPQDPGERLVARFGSEFGDLRNVQPAPSIEQ